MIVHAAFLSGAVVAVIIYAFTAFVSGVIVEALYALGVLFIGARRSIHAAVSSVVWGGAFLVGVNESFRSPWAAGAWCVGLGVGTLLGMRVESLAGRTEPSTDEVNP